MENANFMLLEDKVPVYSTTDIASEEITKLNSGDEIIFDEKLKKNQIQWASIVLSDGRKGYIKADAKGIRIHLAALKQSSADVFERPGLSSKVIKTYNQGERFQIIGGVQQDNLMWVKTESLSGVIGFIQGGVKVEEVVQTTPSEKWPVRGGYIGAGIGVAIVIYFSFFNGDDHVTAGIVKLMFVVAFIAGFIIGYLLTQIFIKIKRSIVQ
jgi:hypothetical protein